YKDTGDRDADALANWKAAREQAKVEGGKWPYDWVEDSAYPKKAQRATVAGAFNLVDPLMPGGARFIGNITVGLTAADHTAATATGAPGRLITWQTDAKVPQFWAKFDDKSGKFAVPNVIPGTYTLRAYADGILGDFAKADIKVEGANPAVDRDSNANFKMNLGTVDWKPVRRGKELWQVGIPNRTAKEFAGGQSFFAPDTQIQYAKLYPDDVNFTIGKSDIAKDWYFEHIPHNIDPNATIVPFSGIRSQPGKATPYKINFDLAAAPKGKATLRIAFCTASAQTLEVAVNDQPAGQLTRLASNGDSTIVRHNIQGIWFERELPFDAALMKQGANSLTLTVPGGSLNNGVIYDCVRLELDEGE
ncbi:MAG TPA: polysaccharide lyase family protein, partial [Phycisphaerae bacterium]|nr:polysaccharide lyase family protein [Phycisphaerae bacterium]